MFFVYIIFSVSADKYYVGQTDNIGERIHSHNNGNSPYTSIARDWKLVYSETYSTRTEVRKRENAIKRKKSRKYINGLS